MQSYRWLLGGAVSLLSMGAFAQTTTQNIWTLYDGSGNQVSEQASVEACAAAASTPGTYRCVPSTKVTVASTEWTFCANEGGTCNFSGTRRVRYGTETANVITTLAGPVACNNATFGDPAFNSRKYCWVGAEGTANPTYPKSQIFALENANITVEAGQDLTLKARFYSVALPDQSKIAAHLYRDGDEYTIVADLMHHYQWIPTQSWSGYMEFDYLINVPAETPPGTYRIGEVIGQGVTPYVGRMDYFDCNGVPRRNLNWSNTVQTCEVGWVTVTPRVHSPSTATNGPVVFYNNGYSWQP
ncbi:MAG TPA: hypothetical protein VGC55_06425 [Dokdonella sp.]